MIMKIAPYDCWDGYLHDVPDTADQVIEVALPTLMSNRHSDDVAWLTNRMKLHVFTDPALDCKPDAYQLEGPLALREPSCDKDSIGISRTSADDVALCTSGLPQFHFWQLFGRPGGCSNQDSQAKTRVCRGRSPKRMNTQTHRASEPRQRRLSARPGYEHQDVGYDTQRSAAHANQRQQAGTSQPCKDLQWKPSDDTPSHPTDRQNPSAHRRGDFTNVTPGHQLKAQGTTKFDAAIARQTHATTTDIYDKLANTCKNNPLYKRGFVSPPTTATATQEQRKQAATGNCAGNTSNQRRFPDQGSHPPHQSWPGHGTRQQRAAQCSEHDAHDEEVKTDWPPLTTNLPSTDVGKQQAEQTHASGAAALLCGAPFWDGE